MWYEIKQPEMIDSPALLLYKDRVAANIETLIAQAKDVGRIRPHVKTHKMREVAEMHLVRGINKFKCATIAEAEMLADAGAADVLLAYQPVGPRAKRLIALAQGYPAVRLGCLLDHEKTAARLGALATAAGVTISVWIDIDNGMARSGIVPDKGALGLYRFLHDCEGLELRGLHVYDGHLRQPVFAERKTASDEAFLSVETLVGEIRAAGLPEPNIVAGGSPAFPVHADRLGVDVSPGTYVFWDAGYVALCPELDFQWAAVVLTRVLSKPGENRICLDVGSKGVSPDKALDKRIHFLNLDTQPRFIGQSEEHLVVEVEDASQYGVGDVWYGVPGHVCPTVNLYEEALIVTAEGEVEMCWEVVARRRMINY